MPLAPPRPCLEPGCGALTTSGRCPRHQAERQRAYDQARAGTPARRLYDRRWKAYRAEYRRQHPWCAPCQAAGHQVASTIVDHKVPHRGDRTLFWSPANHEARCKTCHDSKTAAHDGGFGNPRRPARG